MEGRFSVEAKIFFFLVRVDKANFRLEERRKDFVGFVFVGVQWLCLAGGYGWRGLKSPGKEEFVKSYCEDEKVFVVCGVGNKASRYLEVAIYAEGGWKDIIWLPEGRGGWGWWRFVGELRQLLVPFEANSCLPGSVEISPEGKQMGVGAKASLSRRSFAEVVRATASSAAVSGELKTLPLGHLDLFPVADCFEWTNGGENPRLAVDCSELEKNLKRAEADSMGIVGSMKKAKKKGNPVNRSQTKILRYAWRKMCDRLKAEEGQVVGFGLDQLPSAGFRGVHLSMFLLSPNQFVRWWAQVLLRATRVQMLVWVRDLLRVLGSLQIPGLHCRLKLLFLRRRRSWRYFHLQPEI